MTVDISGVYSSVNRNPTVTDGLAAGDGRWERLGTGTRAGVMIVADLYGPVNYPPMTGSYTDQVSVHARWVDKNNNLRCGIGRIGGNYTFFIAKAVSGNFTTLAQTSVTVGLYPKIVFVALEDGSGGAYLFNCSYPGGPQTLVSIIGFSGDADLATGGTLQTGGYGLHHRLIGTPSAGLMGVANSFAAYGASTTSLPPDAVGYPSRQLELGPNSIKRRSKDGVAYGRVGKYVGGYLRVNPNLTNRFFVSMSRGNPREGGVDGGIDDISARLYYTPRYLVVPD
jgi:hypothetical protein